MASFAATSPTALWGPAFAWSELMFKSAEMMMASGQVIGHRVQRMGQAGLTPSPRDVREFTLMGQEKVAAVAESAQAMSAYWWSHQQQAATQAWQRMLTLNTHWWATMAGGSGAGRGAAWAPWVDAGKAAQAWGPWAMSSTRLLSKGLLPIHSRATANARRLGSR